MTHIMQVFGRGGDRPNGNCACGRCTTWSGLCWTFLNTFWSSCVQTSPKLGMSEEWKLEIRHPSTYWE